jgi:four helix bundle protein
VSGEGRAVTGQRLHAQIMSIQSYRDLEVWQRGMSLAESVWNLTRNFPKEELFGLTSQSRRAAASIPANLAEGWGRRSPKEFCHFIHIAQGSLRELETHLLLAQRVGLASDQQVKDPLHLAAILGRQLIALERSLTRINRGTASGKAASSER